MRKYQNKISRLKSCLSKIEAENDFERDHEQVQLSIMNLATKSHEENEFQKGKLKVVNQERKIHNSGDNGQSLNYYIEDDGEEENNYETFLKFRKKALERDLED